MAFKKTFNLVAYCVSTLLVGLAFAAFNASVAQAIVNYGVSSSLGPNSVQGRHILDGTITDADITATSTISTNKLGNTASGTIPFMIGGRFNASTTDLFWDPYYKVLIIGSSTPSGYASTSQVIFSTGTTTAGTLVATSSLLVGSNADPRAVFLQSGRLGLGTFNPSQILDIVGNATLANANSYMAKSSGAADLTILSISASDILQIGSQTTLTRSDIFGGGTLGVSITSAGRVGISTTTPGSIFSVQGGLNIESGTSTIYTALRSHAFLATGTEATSTFEGGISVARLRATGTTTFNGINYLFPNAHGADGTVLTENGGGFLRWASVGGRSTSSALSDPRMLELPREELSSDTADVILKTWTMPYAGSYSFASGCQASGGAGCTVKIYQNAVATSTIVTNGGGGAACALGTATLAGFAAGDTIDITLSRQGAAVSVKLCLTEMKGFMVPSVTVTND